jgi:uncharacterized RDD family membrane protein YckC
MLYDGVIIIALLMLAALLPVMAGFDGQTALRDPLYTAYLLAVWFLYVAGLWRRGGVTLGMRAWGVRLVTAAGGQPHWPALTLRFLGAWLSAAALGLGFLWALFDPHKSGWHDRLSRTRLVRTR